MLLWLSSVCWVTLNTPNWDILATDLDVYFDSKLKESLNYKHTVVLAHSERIQKRILCFLTGRINPRSVGSLRVKGTKESILEVDSSVPLTRHNPTDL